MLQRKELLRWSVKSTSTFPNLPSNQNHLNLSSGTAVSPEHFLSQHDKLQSAMTASIRQDCPLSLPPHHDIDYKHCSTEDLLQPGRLVVHHGLRKSLLSARHSSQPSCSCRCPKLQSHQATCELSFLSRVVTPPFFHVIYLIFLWKATTPFILSITVSDLIYSAVILPFMAMRSFIHFRFVCLTFFIAFFL